MKQSTVLIMAVMLCAALCAVALVGCGGSSASSTASSSVASTTASSGASSAAASSSASSASTVSSASSASTSAGTASASSSGSLINIDGVDVKKIELEMVGSTPNLSIVFSNSTDKPVDIDCSKFEVKKSDGTVVDFTGSTKTINANQSYMQWAFPAKPDSMKAGDKAVVSYDGTSLGEFEVGEF